MEIMRNHCETFKHFILLGGINIESTSLVFCWKTYFFDLRFCCSANRIKWTIKQAIDFGGNVQVLCQWIYRCILNTNNKIRTAQWKKLRFFRIWWKICIYQLQPLSNDSWNLSLQTILFHCFEYFLSRTWIVISNKVAQRWTINEKRK